MKFDYLRDVVAIAEFGSVRAAARHLGIAQPLLSRNLGNLERALGGKIFERRAQGMVPTSFGAIVIDGAYKILNEVQRLSSAIHGHHGRFAAQTKKSVAPNAGSVLPTQRDRDRADHVFMDVVFEVFRLYGRLMKVGDLMVRPIGLTSSRWQVLGALPHNKATVSEIARYMGLQRQSVQRTIDVLRREGLVELVNNPNHRRAKLAVLTVSGWSKIREANKIRDEWIKRSTIGIPAAEFEAVYEFLRRMRKRLSARGILTAI